MSKAKQTTEAVNAEKLFIESKDFHQIVEPSNEVLDEGLIKVFDAPHKRVKLLVAGKETFDTTKGKTTIGKVVIEDGWFDLSSLSFTMKLRVGDTDSASTQVQALDYATATPATHIALQNGSQLFNNCSLTIKLGKTAIFNDDNAWMWDLISQYFSSNETVLTYGLASGFVPDVGAADVRLNTNTGYVARADFCRPGAAGQPSLPYQFEGRVNLPFFTTNRMIYLEKGDNLVIEVSTNSSNDKMNVLELGAGAAAHRLIDTLTFSIDQYFPSIEMDSILVKKMLSLPQQFIYPDFRVEHATIADATHYTDSFSLTDTNIEAAIIGFQLPAAVNKRQFVNRFGDTYIESLQIERDKEMYPMEAYQPNFANPTQKAWIKPYMDLLKGMNESFDSASAIVTPAMYANFMGLYFFDLKDNPSNLPSKQRVTKKGKQVGDTISVKVKFTGATTVDMYIMLLGSAKVKFFSDNRLEVVQSCM